MFFRFVFFLVSSVLNFLAVSTADDVEQSEMNISHSLLFNLNQEISLNHLKKQLRLFSPVTCHLPFSKAATADTIERFLLF